MEEGVYAMLGLIYFDWKGPRGSVSEYGEKIKEACEKTGAKFKGIWGPHNDKWNFVVMIKAEDHAGIINAFNEAGGMHENMPHCVLSYFTKAWP